MKKMLTTYLFVFIVTFMLYICEPILMYATNQQDFWFDFRVMIGPCLLTAFSVFLLGSVFFTIIKYLCEKVIKKPRGYQIFLAVCYLIFFLIYIEGNYLAYALPPLDGSAINWNSYHLENWITLGVFLLLLGLLIFSIHKFKIEKTIQYARNVSLVVLVMLCASLISTLFREDLFRSKDGLILTDDEYQTISQNKNFLIFLVDAVDSETFSKLLNQHPEYKDVFNDFTYYRDALAAYPFTMNSIPFILSGKWNHNELKFHDYLSNALNESPLFANLKERNYTLNLYDEDVVWEHNAYEIKNSKTVHDLKMDVMNYFKNVTKYAMYKYLPYGLKKYAKMEKFGFLSNVNKYGWSDSKNYQWITEQPNLNIVEENQFKFIHAEGAHTPFKYDKDLNEIENGTYEQKVEASITLIHAFIERLKANHTYDNSVIIVLADHGFGGTNVIYNLNPILFVKGIDEHHQLSISDKKVSYEDLNDAYIELLNEKKSTELFKDFASNRKRKTIWYETLDGAHMVEYETTSTAKDVEKFVPTGNVYDR